MSIRLAHCPRPDATVRVRMSPGTGESRPLGTCWCGVRTLLIMVRPSLVSTTVLSGMWQYSPMAGVAGGGDDRRVLIWDPVASGRSPAELSRDIWVNSLTALAGGWLSAGKTCESSHGIRRPETGTAPALLSCWVTRAVQPSGSMSSGAARPCHRPCCRLRRLPARTAEQRVPPWVSLGAEPVAQPLERGALVTWLGNLSVSIANAMRLCRQVRRGDGRIR